MIFVYEAWHRGDREAMLDRLVPLEAELNRNMETGLDSALLRWRKTIVLLLRGEITQAHAQAEIAFSYETEPPHRLDIHYRHFGWDYLPEFRDLRERYNEYLAAERLKLLAAACGEAGFDSWKPSPETCARQ